MSNAHRTNVLVTSCLKTPVDPHTKAPLASYERQRLLPYTAATHMDNRDYEKELEYEDSGSDFCEDDYPRNGSALVLKDCRVAAERFDLSDIFFSNEEYYSKLEELKKAHLRTMAELESMYHQKLQLQAMAPLDTPEGVHSSPASTCRLRKSHSAVELRRSSGLSDSSEEAEAASYSVEKGLLFSPKEHIKNMWRDFKLSPHSRLLSSSLPGDETARQRGRGKKRPKDGERELWKHRVTVPKPFHMTVREDERRRRGVKTRSEIEMENAELRRQLEELNECQAKFRASPVPAHVHLPLYGELQERQRRRRTAREREEKHLSCVQKPFSFLERERLKKEERQRQKKPPDQDRVKPFKAKPVPRSVYAAASGEQSREEQLYRSIKIQMRAEEMLLRAAMPPSMLTRRLSERKKTKDVGAGGDDFSHRPKINEQVPDFDASYRRFQKSLEKRKEVKPTTACEPFEFRTSQISSHRERILADIEKERSSPRALRWPYVGPASPRTPNSSLCSSLSGSLEMLPAKVTDATKKRHEAVRQALEQRRKAEEEEERWREKQKQREKKLQRVVLKRAQANDPHLTLAQTHQNKLKEFRRQDRQRRKEYQQEIKEIQARVKGRPLLLEQVAQRNAKQAAEKRFTDALQGCDVSEELVSMKTAAAAGLTSSPGSSQSELKDQDEEPLRYRRIFLDDEDKDSDGEDGGGEEDGGGDEDGAQRSDDDESCRYSDDHEEYSEGSQQEEDPGQQEDGDAATEEPAP